MRKITIYILSLLMVFAPAVSFAASPAGWTATVADAAMSGAAVTLKAFKGNGAAAQRAVISYAPTAGKIAKEIVKGGGVLAVAYALSKLLDAGIDWVLDPENNRVKYTTGGEVVDPNNAVIVGGYKVGGGNGSLVNTPFDACMAYTGGVAADCIGITVDAVSGSISACYASGGCRSVGNRVGAAPAAGAVTPVEEKYIPLSTVADQIISDAAAGAAAPADFVKAVAVGAANAGELDAPLDAAAETTTETQTQDPPKPAEPAKPFDPSSILGAIAALGVKLAAMVASLGALTEFFNSEPPPEPTPEDSVIPVDSAPPVSAPSSFDVNYVNFGGQCPVLPSFSIGVGGAVAPMSFDMTPLCNLAVAIRPAIIAIAYFIGLGIIASSIRES